MTCKVIEDYNHNGCTIQLVKHCGYGETIDEYTIQIGVRDNWIRHGGRTNYYGNRQGAEQDFKAICEALTIGGVASVWK